MAELSLSTEIVNNVVEVLKKHDPATSDHLVASQYLAAIIGFIVSKENFTDDQRNRGNKRTFFIYNVSDVSVKTI